MPKRPPVTTDPAPPETATLPAPQIAAVVEPRRVIGGNEAFPGGRAPIFPPGSPMPPNADLGPGEYPGDYVAAGDGTWRRR